MLGLELRSLFLLEDANLFRIVFDDAMVAIASGLSFLGLGVQPPNPEWGAMLSKGRELVRSTPVAAFAPGMAITLLVMSFSLLGDGLRDALDPKLKHR